MANASSAPASRFRISTGFAADADALPVTPGAYLVLIDLKAAAPLPPRFGGALQPGLYVYAGSANGPGGIRARAGRHLKHDKPRRWHVDWLTADARCAALPLPAWDECATVAALATHGRFVAPVAGFGSSDCTTCAAHLLRWTGHGGRAAVEAAIRSALASAPHAR